MPIAVYIQVLKHIFDQEALLGCSVLGRAARRALPMSLQVQEDAFEPAVVCHGTGVT